MMNDSNKPPVPLKLLAGGIAGACETFVTYPAEFIKTRRQLPQPSTSSFPSPGLKPNTSLSLIMSTYRTSGLLGFYSGCSALASSNFLKSGIRFFAFETTRDFLDKVSGTNTSPNNMTGGIKPRSPWINILSGLTAGVVESLVIVTPGEALKTRIVEDAAQNSKNASRFAGIGFTSVATQVVRSEGIGALWRGAVPVMSKQATNSAVRFTVFAGLQESVERRWPGLKGNVGTTLAMGAGSGVVTVYASMPFDNVKTRMQSTCSGYTGMFDCIAKTLKTDGILVFWRGTSPRLVRMTLSSGITFTVYDQVIQTATLLQHQPMREAQAL